MEETWQVLGVGEKPTTINTLLQTFFRTVAEEDSVSSMKPSGA